MKYVIEDKPPVCLHALGQPLVDAIWREGRILFLRELMRSIEESYADGNIDLPTATEECVKAREELKQLNK